jgi:EpsI family protein
MRLPLFLGRRYALALSLLLALQAAAYYSTSTPEKEITMQRLDTFPRQVGAWRMVAEHPLEPEVRNVLRSDDSLSRSYANPDTRQAASLFIAFFRSQKTGAAPHSPKNCLPGSGWAPLDSGTLAIQAPGWPEPVTVNRYIVARGGQRTLVLYWYQTPHRVVASEYMAKIWLVLDALRYRRSDTSLVRVVAPIEEGGEQAGERLAAEFVREFF